MICVYLTPKELANLRVVSRLVGPISLQYMVPEVHLILAKESFEQLEAIANHPIASKYVTSFFFEADKLGVRNREDWQHDLVGPEYVKEVLELPMRGRPCRHATERSLRLLRRGLAKLESVPSHQYTEEEIERAFGKYRELIDFQHDSQQRAINDKEIVKAMKCFPRLKELRMATHYSDYHRPSKLRKLFEPAFCYDYEIRGLRETELLGVQQMRSLLLGAYHAGLKVETLQCGLVSWRILGQDNETFACMRESLSNVKDLRLEFTTGRIDLGDLNLPWVDVEADTCCLYLQAGRLRDLVTAAPNLEHLQVGFACDEPTWATYLKDIVGEHHWPSLKSVNLKMIGATEDDLVSFCSRHASTLKSVHLTSIGFDQGDWLGAFNRMRNFLKLDVMALAGRLEGPIETLDFELDSDECWFGLKEGIEAYFLGACPSDEMSLEDFLDMFLPDTEDEALVYGTDDDDF